MPWHLRDIRLKMSQTVLCGGMKADDRSDCKNMTQIVILVFGYWAEKKRKKERKWRKIGKKIKTKGEMCQRKEKDVERNTYRQ